MSDLTAIDILVNPDEATIQRKHSGPWLDGGCLS